MSSQNTVGYFLWKSSLRSIQYLFGSKLMWKTWLAIKSRLWEHIQGVNSQVLCLIIFSWLIVLVINIVVLTLQNGCVKRKHIHLTETARTFLVAFMVPHKYWVEAFSTKLYLINRLPTSGLDVSPWELLTNKPPNYSKLKVFGRSYYPWLKPYVSSKLEGKSKHCVLLGYNLQHKGYKCLDFAYDRRCNSRHVLFNEHVFPFSQIKSIL